MIIYVDMDDVLCDYSSAINYYRKMKPEISHPQSLEGFFKNLSPITDGIESVNKLRALENIEIYILTAPSVKNPISYMEKRIWIEEKFELDFVEKLIISSNKGLLKGDYLIDDHAEGRGQENFEGEVIYFGREKYPSWAEVMAYLATKI